MNNPTLNFLKNKIREKGLVYCINIGVLQIIPALFYIVILRLIRPLVIIRIGHLDSGRIGHFALITEMYLCEKDMCINTSNQRFLDILYYDSTVCNIQLLKMWNRVLKIRPSRFLSYFSMINSLLPDGKLYQIPLPNGIDINNVFERVPSHISFTPEEENYGRILLESQGVPTDSKFICFVGRDSKYLHTISPDKDWRYHEYRNSDVKTYLLAAEELVNRGYYTIRMGSVVAEALVSNNTRIIDYATNGQRSDFMDIYLGAKCRFFIGSGTGIDEIPKIFRRPVLYVNQAPLEYAHSWNKNHIFIPKKYWLDKEQRFMTFREILVSGAGRFLDTQKYIDRSITLIENTPKEILKVTIEMDERLNGTWVTTEEDEILQKRFWSLFKSSELHGKIYSRIGADFLRENRELLE